MRKNCYVAIESNQIFDLCKNKSLKIIYEELHQRYPNYKLHLGSMDSIQFQKAVPPLMAEKIATAIFNSFQEN